MYYFCFALSTICCVVSLYFALQRRFVFVSVNPKPKVVKRFTLFARKKSKHLLDTAKLLWERGEYTDAKNALHLYAKRESR